MVEIWKDIDGYIGIYQVSNMGNVRSLQREEFKCAQGYRVRKGVELKLSQDQKGYLKVNLCKNGKGRSRRVHRLVAEAFIDNPMHLPEINHIDEDKKNNVVSNLEWCTSSYNKMYGNGNVSRSKTLKEIWKRRRGKQNDNSTLDHCRM